MTFNESTSVDSLINTYEENLVSYGAIYTGDSIRKFITYPINFYRFPISDKEKESISKNIDGVDINKLNKLNYNFELFNYLEEFLPEIGIVDVSSYFSNLIIDILEINDHSELFFTANKNRLYELKKSSYKNIVCEFK